ncbi:hypothetical protein ACFYTF_29470 [Nocardia thailandica]|uniref:DUF3349 domain-containing protein n=1 Tax=Nocardia thailandica TaxID=257275 RepID=A0ABW6PX79_9NOCA
MPEDDDPIPAEQAAVMAVVIDHIEPDRPLTAEQLHALLVAEVAEPPSPADVRDALAILSMPHVGYRPGEPSAVVLERMRDMLDEAESGPPPIDLGDFRY